jgi:hypothetical protein
LVEPATVFEADIADDAGVGEAERGVQADRPVALAVADDGDDLAGAELGRVVDEGL